MMPTKDLNHFSKFIIFHRSSVNLNRDFFREHFGPDLKSYQSFVDMNPKAPLWAFADRRFSFVNKL